MRIDVFVYIPGQQMLLRQVENNLNTLQEIVGGLIEVVTLPHGFTLICNEEGKLMDLPPHRWVPSIQDVICGTFIVCRTSGSEFSSVSYGDDRAVDALIRPLSDIC